MDLALPLRVGCLRASVSHPDRTGLKKLLIRWLWLTHAGVGGGGVVQNAVQACAAGAGVML